MKISYQLIKEYRHFFTLFGYLKAPEGFVLYSIGLHTMSLQP